MKYEVSRAKLRGQSLGIKLVRGCYMDEERILAKKLGYKDPLNENIAATAKCFKTNFEYFIENREKGFEILAATHNEESVGWIQKYMHLFPDNIRHSVTFGQLLGLSDHLTNSLKNNGYLTYKNVVYGDISIVVPYLIRRAVEAKTSIQSVHLQYDLMKSELWSRLWLFS